jgi:hypothetical protein
MSVGRIHGNNSSRYRASARPRSAPRTRCWRRRLPLLEGRREPRQPLPRQPLGGAPPGGSPRRPRLARRCAASGSCHPCGGEGEGRPPMATALRTAELIVQHLREVPKSTGTTRLAGVPDRAGSPAPRRRRSVRSRRSTGRLSTKCRPSPRRKRLSRSRSAGVPNRARPPRALGALERPAGDRLVASPRCSSVAGRKACALLAPCAARVSLDPVAGLPPAASHAGAVRRLPGRRRRLLPGVRTCATRTEGLVARRCHGACSRRTRIAARPNRRARPPLQAAPSPWRATDARCRSTPQAR